MRPNNSVKIGLTTSNHRFLPEKLSIFTHDPSLEEIEKQAREEDSVAGLTRFLIGKFPVVVNKIMPDVPPSEVQNILLNDPDYFNDILYDDVVGGLAWMVGRRVAASFVCM